MKAPRTPRASRALAVCAALLLCACSTSLSERDQSLLEIYTNTAESYYQLGDHDRAVAQSLKALEIDPDNLKLRLILGWSLQRRGTTEDVLRAEQVFRSIADEQDFRAPLGLAKSLERQGVAHDEAADALEAGKRVTEASDPKQRIAELRARSLALWTESRSWYERTLKLQKSNLDALNGLQRVEALLGRPEESLARGGQLLEALKLDRDYWERQLKKTQIGDREEKEMRRTIQALVDVEVATRLHCARTEYELDRLERAMAQLDAAIELNRGRADLHGMRAVVQRDLGRWEAAIADAERYIALSTAGVDSPDVKRAFDLISACEVERARKNP
ncbi:MAG: hypothetical protein JNK02_10200 [Planctomycetes bacterium]|nr:hypothetical protein [Planctomycetota bacterium]